MSIINDADTTLDNLTVLTCILRTLKSRILTQICRLSEIVWGTGFWLKPAYYRGLTVYGILMFLDYRLYDLDLHLHQCCDFGSPTSRVTIQKAK